MTGILASGAYVPMTRLPLASIAGSESKAEGPERAAVGFDEDSVTMAVAAAVDCLRGRDRAAIDGVFFASTTSPYREKLAAAIVSKALDLRRDLRVADFGGSLRAGTAALRAALDAVTAGPARNMLVVAADCRLASPRSAMERDFGDAAVAFLVGTGRAMATVDAWTSISDEILDVWRAEEDRFVRSWEERFVVEHGYLACLREVVGALQATTGVQPSSFKRVALYAPDPRSHSAAARTLGFSREQLQDAFFGRIGNCGAAFAPLLLAAALDGLAAGDHALVLAYGDGADAFVVEKQETDAGHPRGRGVAGFVARRRPLVSYDSYLAARNLAPGAADRLGGAGIAATVHHRERDADIGFVGARCRRCSTVHFPAQRVCYGCQAKDDFERERLSGRRGRVMSYSFDHFFPIPEPPLIATMVETDQGCRVYLQMTDARPEELRCDLAVEFVFRKIHEAGGKPNYFWKCTPLRGEPCFSD